MKENILCLLSAFFLTSLIFSCKKVEPILPPQVELDCVEAFVQKNNLIPYSGQVLSDCTDMFLLFEYGGKDYLMHDNNCADMIAIPIDCDSVPLCQSFDDPVLNDFYRNAVYQKIVAIWP